MLNPNHNLNIAIQSWIEIEDFVIPIYVDIADIKWVDEDFVVDDKIEMINGQIRFNKLNSPFQQQYKDYSLKENIKSYLKFVDKRKLFNGLNESYYEGNLEHFYNQLIQSGFTTLMFVNLKNEINYYINKVKFKFLTAVTEILDYERSFPFIRQKEETPENIKKLMAYPSEMSLFQSAIEYTNTIIFPENIGKAFTDYSWREIQFKVMYISMKNSIEGFANKYSMRERDTKPKK